MVWGLEIERWNEKGVEMGSMDCSIDHSTDRSTDCSMVCSTDRSTDCSIDRSTDCSMNCR